MNSEKSDNLSSMSTTGLSGTTGTTGMSGSSGLSGSSSMAGGTGMNSSAGAPQVQRVAQRAHETVDRLEQSLSSGAEKMMGWHQEYGELAREQIRANPLAVVAGAFAVGYLFAKITR
jgi:hypothetical protein